MAMHGEIDAVEMAMLESAAGRDPSTRMTHHSLSPLLLPLTTTTTTTTTTTITHLLPPPPSPCAACSACGGSPCACGPPASARHAQPGTTRS